ncbi:hypothetical protein K0M31_002749 [Melipona bicolor]|uniref:Uncharacterized protein n=1 Tax=Melipona bicolor TaxID=60889 RepID=A0AA40KPW7_9HYME|nr:hypothetical protein K0M31_002749 [Melipona bicolor]
MAAPAASGRSLMKHDQTSGRLSSPLTCRTGNGKLIVKATGDLGWVQPSWVQRLIARARFAIYGTRPV